MRRWRALARCFRSSMISSERLKAASAIGSAGDEFVKGIELIYNRLMETLTKQGLEPIEQPRVQKFDPHLHDAVQRVRAGRRRGRHDPRGISARVQLQREAAATGDGESRSAAVR